MSSPTPDAPCIVTLTLNPSVDLILDVERVQPEKKLRTSEPQYHAGGGGINVSRVVDRLGGRTVAVYTSGGATGELLQGALDAEGLDHRPITIRGRTRLNPNVMETSTGSNFRFILPGPHLSIEQIDRCVDEALALNATWLVLSGSLPPGADSSTYRRIPDRLADRDVRVVVDASGPSLREALKSKVYLVKPNLRELSDLVGRELEGDRAVVAAARELVGDGPAEVVVVSLGGGGAMVVTLDAARKLTSPSVKVRSAIGAGDSMVAGMTLALARGWDAVAAARYGIAAGAAAVKTPGTELCHADDVEQLHREMLEHERSEA